MYSDDMLKDYIRNYLIQEKIASYRGRGSKFKSGGPDQAAPAAPSAR